MTFMQEKETINKGMALQSFSVYTLGYTHEISKPGHVRILSIATQPVTMFFKFLFHKSCVLFNKTHYKQIYCKSIHIHLRLFHPNSPK